jgi:transposase
METKDTKAIKRRRIFDESFKRDAVALVLKGEKSLPVIAEELGVNHWALREWKRRFGPAAPVKGQDALELELRALRRENEHLRTQRDILKKTLGILADPNPNGSPS